MKTHILILLLAMAFSSACAQINDPVAHFRSTSTDQSSKLMKWSADINGDGKPEMFLSNKDDYDADVVADTASGWFVFFADTTGNTFTESKGLQEAGEDSIGVGGLSMIDLSVCFVGLVTEIAKHAVITQQIDTPRAGDPVARIYAYTIEGDHLKRTKLAEYNPQQPNAIFDKYLKDGKRTVIIPVEVNP